MGGRSEEERGFTVLLEEVRHEYKLLSERVTGLEQKVDRGFQEVHRNMEIGFKDIQTGIKDLVSQLREHSHTNGSRRPGSH